MKKLLMVLIIIMFLCAGFLSGCNSEPTECSACDGTGKCNRCEGTGWAADLDLKCDKCDGTGDCQTCDGTGYISNRTPGFELIVLMFAAILFIIFRKRKNS